MGEYSCISLDALSTCTDTLPNEANQWRFLAISPEGVTYLVNANSMVPGKSIEDKHIKDKITCSCISGLGSAAGYSCSDFAPADLATCPGLNLDFGTGENCVARGNHNHDSNYLGLNSKAASAASADNAAALSTDYICFGTNCIWIGD